MLRGLKRERLFLLSRGRVLGSGRFLTNFALFLCRINGELLQGNLTLGKRDIHPAP